VIVQVITQKDTDMANMEGAACVFYHHLKNDAAEAKKKTGERELGKASKGPPDVN